MSDEINETTANLMEALSNLTSAIIDKKNALDDSNDQSMSAERKLAQELENLGIVVKSGGGAFSTYNEKLQQRAELEEEVNKKLRENVDALRNSTDEEIEEYKNGQRRNQLYQQELSSLGRMIKANGDIVKTTVELDSAQKKVIDGFKRVDQSDREKVQAQEQFNQTLRNLPGQLGVIGLTFAFDMLKAEVVGTYKAMIAMEDALLAGQEGLSVETAGTAAKMQEAAKAVAKLGSSLSSVSDGFIVIGIAMTSVSWPLRLLSVAIGGLLKLFGMAAEAQAAAMERDAEMEKKRGELNDKLSDSFKKLGSSGLAGADGMTGLFKNLGKLNLNLNHLAEYTRVLNDSQKNLAMIGGTAIEGVKKFSEVAGSLIYSGLGTIIRRMGIQNEEMMAHTASFMSQQARLGLKTTGDVSKATGEYILELDRLALITGTTRKKEEEAREAVLKIAQLRAAILDAEGDKPKQEMLKRALEQSSAMMAAGMTGEGGNLAKLAASGFRPTDTGQARLLSASPELIKAIKEGTGTVETRYFNSIGELIEREKSASKTTKFTGEVKGYSIAASELAPLLDQGENRKALQSNKPANMDLVTYLKDQRNVTDQKQIKQEATEKANRDTAYALQMQIMDGHYSAMSRMLQTPAGTMLNAANKMLEASLNFLKSVGKSLYESGQEARKSWDAWDPFGKKSPATVAGGGKGASRNFSGGQASTNNTSAPAAHQTAAASPPPKLAKVSSINGKSASVNADLAPNFQGLISYLDKIKYPITDLGGYNDRDVRGQAGTKSYHAKGGAIDINSATNPMSSTLKTDMPDNISQIASGFGLGWGGNWKSSKDAMHFSAGEREGGTLMAKTGGVFDGPPGGYPIELHGREAVVPLPNVGDKISIDKPQKEDLVTKNPLSSVLSKNYPVEPQSKKIGLPPSNPVDMMLSNDKAQKDKSSNKSESSPIVADNATISKDNSSVILTDLYHMMENKFNDMIDKLDTGNNYSDKLVKAMI